MAACVAIADVCGTAAAAALAFVLEEVRPEIDPDADAEADACVVEDDGVVAGIPGPVAPAAWLDSVVPSGASWFSGTDASPFANVEFVGVAGGRTPFMSTSTATESDKRVARQPNIARVGAKSSTDATDSSVASSPPNDAFAAAASAVEGSGSSVGFVSGGAYVNGRRGIGGGYATDGWKSISPAMMGSS